MCMVLKTELVGFFGFVCLFIFVFFSPSLVKCWLIEFNLVLLSKLGSWTFKCVVTWIDLKADTGFIISNYSMR